MRHALIKCSHARNFWREAEVWLKIKLPELHPDTWTRDILCDHLFSETDRASIITVMWSIWSSRNNIVHDKGAWDPAQSVKMTRDALALLDIPMQHARIFPSHGWRPPDEGWVKINTDASICSDSAMGGAGGIARTHLAFVGAWSKPFPGVTDQISQYAGSPMRKVCFFTGGDELLDELGSQFPRYQLYG
jgi:hypothetical protein